MHELIYKQIGKNIKHYRELRKLTQQQLADKINKGLNFVGKIEVAYAKPSFNTLIDISIALDVPLSELVKANNDL